MLSKFKATTKAMISHFRQYYAGQKLEQLHNRWFCMVDNLGQRLSKWHISANFITILGFLIGMLAVNFLAMQIYWAALICILINRFFDVLDGAVARCRAITNFGIFLDAVLDYIFYAGIIFGFALASPSQNAVAACFLLFGFMASACAMVVYAAITFKNNHDGSRCLEQSPFYLGGLAQGAETLVAMLILCLIPQWFLPVAIVLGCWCLLKALTVITTAYYNFVIAEKGKD